MTTEHLAGIDVQHVEHPKRGQLTRLTWHGWQVDFDALSVTVPPQQNPARTGDLDTLLRAAYRMLDIAVVHQRRPLTAVRAELPEPLAAELVAVLRAAQRIVDRRWDRRSTDVYAATSQAWQDADMTVPYALLVATLREALPPTATNLADYEHAASPQALYALYDGAISLWCTDHADQARPSRIA
jgi:hypothetical protein